MGKINSIYTGSAVDGPGIRSVVFFQGCPLRCAYCHNPETQVPDGGKDMDPEEVFDKVSRYAGYYGKKGGVTFSGGEVLLQPEFLISLLKLCKAANIHCAIDTCGYTGADTPKEIFELCDLVILDVKMNNEEDYRTLTGGSFKKTMEFLDLCEMHKTPVWIRQVTVPGINDTPEHAENLGKLLSGKKCIEKTELLPFEKLCCAKYENLGIKFPLENTPAMDRERLKDLQRIVADNFNR